MNARDDNAYNDGADRSLNGPPLLVVAAIVVFALLSVLTDHNGTRDIRETPPAVSTIAGFSQLRTMSPSSSTAAGFTPQRPHLDLFTPNSFAATGANAPAVSEAPME